MCAQFLVDRDAQRKGVWNLHAHLIYLNVHTMFWYKFDTKLCTWGLRCPALCCAAQLDDPLSCIPHIEIMFRIFTDVFFYPPGTSHLCRCGIVTTLFNSATSKAATWVVQMQHSKAFLKAWLSSSGWEESSEAWLSSSGWEESSEGGPQEAVQTWGR